MEIPDEIIEKIETKKAYYENFSSDMLELEIKNCKAQVQNMNFNIACALTVLQERKKNDKNNV